MVQFQLWASIQQILFSTSYESEVTGVGLDLVTGRNRAAGKICNLVGAGGFQANEFDCA